MLDDSLYRHCIDACTAYSDGGCVIINTVINIDISMNSDTTSTTDVD